ncbi:uncharacterized protein LOC102810177 [Saccoglossus kowalevskii]|uniref:Uncharacterized protein LOC102810177 n=1 Tax=Saccoglossus kowalevskii TaxID=10224 RepID=A0ABM0MLE3_SACKO|nr:PREDICTED: uncharacterized protein LOC102810177 [Saccoglossus kowalevskii]
MNVCVVLLLLAVIGAAVSDDVGKGENTRMDKPVERELHHLSDEKKSEMVNRRKEYLKAHPEVEGSPKLAQEVSKLLRNKKEKMMGIKQSELSSEEKVLQLENLKQDYRSQIKTLAIEANGRAELAAERRRTLELRKERKSGRESNLGHPKFGESKMEN